MSSCTGVNLLVKGLPLNIDEKCLKKVLEEHGPVLKIQLVKYSWFQQSHAYVQFARSDSTENAIKKLNNSTFCGKKITVNMTENEGEMKNNNADDANPTEIEEKEENITRGNNFGNQLDEHHAYAPLYSHAGSEITLDWMTEDGDELKNNNNDNPTIHESKAEMKLSDLAQKSNSERASELEKLSDKNANDTTIKPNSEKRCIKVGWLSPKVSEQFLRDKCSKFGTVEFMKLLKSSNNYKEEQHAYIRFDSHSSAEEAIKALNNFRWFTKTTKAYWTDWAYGISDLEPKKIPVESCSNAVSFKPIEKREGASSMSTNPNDTKLTGRGRGECIAELKNPTSIKTAVPFKSIDIRERASPMFTKPTDTKPTGKGRGECIAIRRAAREAKENHIQWPRPRMEASVRLDSSDQFCGKVEEWLDSSDQFIDKEEDLKNCLAYFDKFCDKGEELKNPPRIQAAPCFKGFRTNQSINHRFSSIVHGYNSARIARAACQEVRSGVKYVLEVSINAEMEGLANALKLVKKNKEVDTGTKSHLDQKAVERLGEQLIQILKAVDWTKLASLYNKTASFRSTRSKMSEADVLARLSREEMHDEKNVKLERRVTKLKKDLHSIVFALEYNEEEGKGVKSVPDIEESLRKVDECLDQSVQKVDEEVMLWAKIKIEDILDKIDSAWNVVQGESMMKETLTKMKSLLGLFGNKYKG